jgi:hypothetical protein
MYTSKSELKHLMRVVDVQLMQSDAMYALAVSGAPSTPRSAEQRRALRQHGGGPLAALPPPPATATAGVGNASAYLPMVGNGRAQSALMTHHDAATGTAYVQCSISPPGACAERGAGVVLVSAARLEHGHSPRP